jgi:hypothetical protein
MGDFGPHKPLKRNDSPGSTGLLAHIYKATN